MVACFTENIEITKIRKQIPISCTADAQMNERSTQKLPLPAVRTLLAESTCGPVSTSCRRRSYLLSPSKQWKRSCGLGQFISRDKLDFDHLRPRRIASSEHSNNNLIADCLLFDFAQKVLHLPNRRAVDVRDEIGEHHTAVASELGRLQPGGGGGAAGHNLDHQHAGERALQLRLERAHHLVVGDVDADGRLHYPTEADDLVDHAPHRVHRDGESYADVTASSSAGRDDGGVDADEPAARVEERPTRVARVDGRVGLDAVLDSAAARGDDVAAERGDDALCERVVEAERVADRKDRLADLEIVRGANLNRRRERP
mmetsp:Transcript_4253/g.9135  ORF Transcript_4253/g.9135 Transcript_4253/m.9135 type:complete len:315 (-) Transcript_4253:891-1835(-)